MSFKKPLLLEFTNFQDIPGPPTTLKTFPGLEHAQLAFKYFQGFRSRTRTNPVTSLVSTNIKIIFLLTGTPSEPGNPGMPIFPASP